MTERNQVPATWTEARQAGSRFYAGFPCPRHAGSARYTVNKRCVACAKAERLARAQANPAAERARKARRTDAPAYRRSMGDASSSLSPMAELLAAALKPA